MNKLNRNYFQLREYSFRRYLNKDNYWVIRADARDTGKKNIDLTTMNSFTQAMVETSKSLSFTYLIYTQSDEINIFITNLEHKQENEISKIVSYYSQIIFSAFNSAIQDTMETLFRVKVLPLKNPAEVKGYIAYRRIFARNLYLTHAIRKAGIPYIHINNAEKKRLLIKKNCLTDNPYLFEGAVFINGRPIYDIEDLDFEKNSICLADDF